MKPGLIGRTLLALGCFVLGNLGETSPSGATPPGSFLFSAALPSDRPALPVLSAGSTTADGEVFSIPILIANVQGLTSCQFDLSFDPSVIHALRFTDIGTDFATTATTGGGSLTGITGLLATSRRRVS